MMALSHLSTRLGDLHSPFAAAFSSTNLFILPLLKVTMRSTQTTLDYDFHTLHVDFHLVCANREENGREREREEFNNNVENT